MSNIVDMSDALIEWEQPTVIKTVTNTTVDFVPVLTVVARTQLCVVQVAEKQKLNPQTIDWALEYILVHSRADIVIGELIEDDGQDYIVTERGPWRGYGYFEVVAAETNRPLVAPT